MRILHITPGFQHPTVRGPHRHYHFLRELSSAHDVTLLTLLREHVDAEALREVGAYARDIVAFNVNGAAPKPAGGLVGRMPQLGKRAEKHLQVRGGIQAMRAAYRSLAESGRFDVVLFHGKSVFPVIEHSARLPVVIDFCDATSMRLASRLAMAGPLARAILWWRYRQVLRLERRMLARTPHRAFISPRDRAAVLGHDDGSPIVPNGVDLDYWRRTTVSSAPNKLVFTGVMDYQPNADAAEWLIDTIVPHVRARVPGVKVAVVGRGASADLVARGARAGVTVTGPVDDLRPFLEAATLFVAPLRVASGMQNKVLEAMAMALPVVTTSAAADGLAVDATPPPVVVADDAAAFAERVVDLLGSPAARDRLATDGRRFVEARFDWGRSAGCLARMCERAVATQAAPARCGAR